MHYGGHWRFLSPLPLDIEKTFSMVIRDVTSLAFGAYVAELLAKNPGTLHALRVRKGYYQMHLTSLNEFKISTKITVAV